jgi:hypothetical protein
MVHGDQARDTRLSSAILRCGGSDASEVCDARTGRRLAVIEEIGDPREPLQGCSVLSRRKFYQNSSECR